jgi:hypothetical protein
MSFSFGGIIATSIMMNQHHPPRYFGRNTANDIDRKTGQPFFYSPPQSCCFFRSKPAPKVHGGVK